MPVRWSLSLTRDGRAEARGGRAPVRNAGVLLAAHVVPGNAPLVCDLMRKGGAQDIERAQGHWREGRWADFDPLARRCRRGPKASRAAHD